MINSFPCQLYFTKDKSVARRCFCPSVWTCIRQDLLVLLIHDNVINLVVHWGSLLCYRVSSSLQPGCNVLCRVLEAAACDEFTILFTEFHQVGTILPLDHCLIQLLKLVWALLSPVWDVCIYVYDADDILCLHLRFINLDSKFPFWFAIVLCSISTGIRIPG